MKNMIFISLMGLLVSATAAFSSESAPQLSFSENYQKNILPFYYQAPEKSLLGLSNANLIYKVFEAPDEKGAIVFVTGWTETHP